MVGIILNFLVHFDSPFSTWFEDTNDKITKQQSTDDSFGQLPAVSSHILCRPGSPLKDFISFFYLELCQDDLAQEEPLPRSCYPPYHEDFGHTCCCHATRRWIVETGWACLRFCPRFQPLSLCTRCTGHERFGHGNLLGTAKPKGTRNARNRRSTRTGSTSLRQSPKRDGWLQLVHSRRFGNAQSRACRIVVEFVIIIVIVKTTTTAARSSSNTSTRGLCHRFGLWSLSPRCHGDTKFALGWPLDQGWSTSTTTSGRREQPQGWMDRKFLVKHASYYVKACTFLCHQATDIKCNLWE